MSGKINIRLPYTGYKRVDLQVYSRVVCMRSVGQWLVEIPTWALLEHRMQQWGGQLLDIKGRAHSIDELEPVCAMVDIVSGKRYVSWEVRSVMDVLSKVLGVEYRECYGGTDKAFDVKGCYYKVLLLVPLFYFLVLWFQRYGMQDVHTRKVRAFKGDCKDRFLGIVSKLAQ